MKKLERNPILDAKAQAVFVAAKGLKRGEVIPHEVIEAASGETRYKGSWTSIINKLNRLMLRERNIALWPERGVGYRLCTHEEQINLVAEKRSRRAERQLGRAAQALEALPAAELTSHQQVVRWFRENEIRQQKKAMQQSRREQERVYKTQTLPRPGF